MKTKDTIIGLLKDIDCHEELVSDIKMVIDENLESSIDQHTQEQIARLALKLPPLTQSIKNTILYLRDEMKIFTRKYQAFGGKEAFVSSVMVYKKADSLKKVLQDYEDVRNLV